MQSKRTHNWNQIHRVVTLKLGFRQVSSYRNAAIYYKRNDGIVIPIQKSNVLTQEYVKKLLPFFGISYNDFISLYKN